MFHPHPDVAMLIAQEQIQERLREAETRRLLHDAGVDQRDSLSRRVVSLLSGIGHRFVVLGRRLGGHEVAPATAPTELQMACTVETC